MRDRWKEKLAFIGTGVALSTFITATLVRHWVWAFWMCLLASVSGMGVLVVGLFKGLHRLERIKKLKKDLRGLDSEKAGIEKRFEIETASVKRFFEAIHLVDVDEIQDCLKARKEIQDQIASALATLEGLEHQIPEPKLRNERNLPLRSKRWKIDFDPSLRCRPIRWPSNVGRSLPRERVPIAGCSRARATTSSSWR